MNEYSHKNIEKYIQKFWKKKETFKSITNYKKIKYYCLSMFPYPSGNLHIGHIRNYTIGDIFSRFNRMKGKNVLYPIGWDSFGLPAENAAIKNNMSPNLWTFNNINYMRKQLKSFGFSFDWNREIITSSEKYYKWEQLFFKKLYKKKIVYKKKYPVNWCFNDKTVLANEQIINNKCWRCGKKVSFKYINQWFLKISNYSKVLLNEIKNLKFWPKEVKIMQKNWIGESKWIKLKLNILNTNEKNIYLNIKNIDEFINIKYLIISYKSEFYKKNIYNLFEKNSNFLNEKFLYKYIKKNGYVITNVLIIHNFFRRYIPLIISDINYFIYVYYIKYINKDNFDLLDIKFYKKYFKKNNLKLKIVNFYNYINYFFCINLNKNIFYKILNINKKFIKIKYYYKYNLQDWCISRQRQWGNVIPVANFNNGKFLLVPDKYIPLKNNYKNGIKNIFIKNKKLHISNETFDTFIQSSWYYVRYTSPKYNKYMVNKYDSDYWLPINQYIGGIEHSTMHLLYFRFYNRVLKDFNIVKNYEPAIKLLCQGMVLSKTYYFIDKNNNKKWINYKDINKFKKKYKIYFDGFKKMSKSKNNGVNPDKIINKYGADTLRIFIIFSAPIKSNLIWNESNISGSYKFLKKVWNLVINHINNKNNINFKNNNYINENLYNVTFNTIKNITDDIEYKNSFNISISYLMKFANILIKETNKKEYNYNILQDLISVLLRMLYIFAPHISFFLWNKIGFSKIDYSEWPNKSKYKLKNNYILYFIQINNKFKSKINVDSDYDKNKTINYIKNKVNFLLKDSNILNIIFIKNRRIINFLLKKK